MGETIRRRPAWANAIPVVPPSRPFVADGVLDLELGFFRLRDDPHSTDEQLAQLRALLSDHAVTVGARSSADAVDALDSIVESIRSESVDIDAFGPLMHALARRPDLVLALADQDTFGELSHLVLTHKRRQGLRWLRREANDPMSTAESMLKLIREQWWVFGGHLVPMRSASRIGGLPEHCLAMVRFDLAIHLILVESPNIGDLVVRRADGVYAIAPTVYEAFDHARMLVGLLQNNPSVIDTELPFKTSRVFVTVLIGQPKGIRPEVPTDVAREQIRLLNTFTSGIAVLTYDELINTAEHMLPG